MRHPEGCHHRMDRVPNDEGDALGKLEVPHSRAHVKLLKYLVSQELHPARGAAVAVTQGVQGTEDQLNLYPTQVLITNLPYLIFHGLHIVIRHSSASMRARAPLCHQTQTVDCTFVIQQRAVREVIHMFASPLGNGITSNLKTSSSKNSVHWTRRDPCISVGRLIRGILCRTGLPLSLRSKLSLITTILRKTTVHHKNGSHPFEHLYFHNDRHGALS